MPTSDHLSSPIFSSLTPVLEESTDPTYQLRERLQQWCGVHIGPDKSYLLTNRLRSLMQEIGVTTYDALLKLAEGNRGLKVRERIIDALTTHETLFFRDKSPFDAIRNHLIPEIRRAAGKCQPTLRIWSAACSTGQEPYSIAMCLVESIPDLSDWTVSIVATDVSAQTVAIAKEGRYQEHEISRGTTAQQRQRFFERDEEGWSARNNIRRMVQFMVGDLTSTTQPAGTFDMIFCRNVLIYFQREVAQRVLGRVVDRLSSSGRLFLGSSEIPLGAENLLVTERLGTATCFRRR